MPGFLLPSDLEHFKQVDLLRASPGGTVMNTVTGRVWNIRTIVPATQPNGHCVFLTAEGRCSVHQHSPFGCAFFDSHQPPHVVNPLSQRALMTIDDDRRAGGLYSHLWDWLHASGMRAEAPMVLRDRMTAAWQREVKYGLANASKPGAV